MKEVSEAERIATETAIAEKLGENAPEPISGSGGNSPYSPEAIVFLAIGADERGTKVSLASVCKSHDGAGRYKGRGRWREVYICAPKADGELAVCKASDRDAQEVGDCSGFYIRPWAIQEAENKSQGMGLAQSAMDDAFAALGL